MLADVAHLLLRSSQDIRFQYGLSPLRTDTGDALQLAFAFLKNPVNAPAIANQLPGQHRTDPRQQMQGDPSRQFLVRRAARHRRHLVACRVFRYTCQLTDESLGTDITHLAFEVDNLEKFAAHAAAKGCALSDGPTPTGSGSVIAFIDAPEGYEIELIQRGKEQHGV